MPWSSKFGIQIYIQTEQYNEPRFIYLDKLEIISLKIPSSWIMTMQQFGDQTLIFMLPKSLTYDIFFQELDDKKSEYPSRQTHLPLNSQIN